MSDNNQSIQDIIDLHQFAHGQYREAIAELDSAALNWTPGPDTSSIGTIITHALGSGAEILRITLGMPTNRVRDAEFAAQDHQFDSLLSLIDATEDDWRNLAPGIREDQLQAIFSRPNRPEARSGHFWLVRNHGHLREHLAQVWFTRQLYESRESK